MAAFDGMLEFRRLWQEYLDGPWVAWAEDERPRRRSIDFYNKLYQIHPTTSPGCVAPST